MSRIITEQNAKIKTLESDLLKAKQSVEYYKAVKVNSERLVIEKEELEKQITQFESVKQEKLEAERRVIQLQAEKQDFLSIIGRESSPAEFLKHVRQLRHDYDALKNEYQREASLRKQYQERYEVSEQSLSNASAEKSSLVDQVQELSIQIKNHERSRELLKKEIGMLKEQLESYDLEDTMNGQNKRVRIDLSQDLKDRISELERGRPWAHLYSLISVDLQQVLDDKKVSEQELAALKQEKNARILALPNNPESEEFAIRKALLNALKSENNALRSGSAVGVPMESYKALQLELSQTLESLAEKDKRIDRLKSVFSSKTAEYRQCISTLLGYAVDVVPDKVIFTSVYGVKVEYIRETGEVRVEKALRGIVEEYGKYGVHGVLAAISLYLGRGGE